MTKPVLYEMCLQFHLTLEPKDINHMLHLQGFSNPLIQNNTIVELKQTIPFIPTEETLKNI